MYRKFIASFLLLLVAACASQQKTTPTVTVPDKLKAPANESLVMIVPAKGVQSVNTAGGIAPKTGCSQSNVGTTARIPYTADYYFLSEK
jgi:Protein of unknown function (DUF3455)